MTRRSMLFCTIFLTVLLAACKSKTETLSLLVWEGYADPSFLQPFEQSHHCKVVAAYMGSSDELVAKRSEEHTSELQSLRHLVCRLLLEKKNHVLRSQARLDT